MGSVSYIGALSSDRAILPKCGPCCAKSFCMVRRYGSKMVQFHHNHNLGSFINKKICLFWLVCYWLEIMLNFDDYFAVLVEICKSVVFIEVR